MATSPSNVVHPDPGPRVVSYMRIVANGIAENGRAKATLIVTPRSPAGGEGATLHLATWPGDIVKNLADVAEPDRFPVKLSLSDPSEGSLTPIRPKNPSFAALADEQNGLDAINKLWRDAIEGTGDTTPWQTLLDDIDRSASGAKTSADLEPSYTYGPHKDNALADNGALIAGPYDPTKKTVIKGVIPNPQTTYAVQTEAGRAQRVVRKLMIGPYLPGDQDVIQSTEVPDPEDVRQPAQGGVAQTIDRTRSTIPKTTASEATTISRRSRPNSTAALRRPRRRPERACPLRRRLKCSAGKCSAGKHSASPPRVFPRAPATSTAAGHNGRPSIATHSSQPQGLPCRLYRGLHRSHRRVIRGRHCIRSTTACKAIRSFRACSVSPSTSSSTFPMKSDPAATFGSPPARHRIRSGRRPDTWRRRMAPPRTRPSVSGLPLALKKRMSRLRSPASKFTASSTLVRATMKPIRGRAMI